MSPCPASAVLSALQARCRVPGWLLAMGEEECSCLGSYLSWCCILVLAWVSYLPAWLLVHLCVGVYIYMCMHRYVFTPHKPTHARLLIQKACGSRWEVRIQAWLCPPIWHRDKKGRCRFVHACTPIALRWGCRSPLTVGSRLPAVTAYYAWKVHLCSLWQGCVPAEGRQRCNLAGSVSPTTSYSACLAVCC